MKTVEKKIIKFEDKIDFRKIKLKEEDPFSRNNIIEIVRETYYEGKRLVRFRTIRKEEEEEVEGGVIIESGYAVNGETAEIEQISSGIYYEKKNSRFYASERYSELNKFLEEQKR